MQDIQDEITQLEHTEEGRRASDAGQCSTRQQQLVLWRSSRRHFHSLRGFVKQKDAISAGLSRSRSTKLARVVQRWRKRRNPETGGLSTTTATEGTKQVPSPDTPVELQGKHLDEHMDAALSLDADRLPTQVTFLNHKRQIQITPEFVNRGGSDGGVPQGKK